MKSNFVYRTVQTISQTTAVLVFCLIVAASVSAQTYNPYAGGYNGGYGTVWRNPGSAMLSQVIQANANAWRAKNKVAAPRSSASRGNAAPTAVRSNPRTAPTRAQNNGINYAVFKPDSTVETAKLFADSLGTTADEKKLLSAIFKQTKTSFESATAAKGWRNNYAGAMTFFVVTAVTVYRDGPEPSEAGADNFFNGLSQVIDGTPEFAKIPDREKQDYYNKMIGFSGLLLAGYTEGKQTNNPETLKAYKQIAGMLIEMILKTDPNNINVVNGNIEFR